MEQPTAVPPESVTWRLHIDRSMWVAGVRGLMLQALHPVAMQGVWQRSDFMDDPTGRLLRTADFVAATTYGSPREAEELGARVRAVHRRLRFTDPATGARHRVDEPDLLLWVHCAEVVSYLEVVARAGARLGPDGADRYFAEQARTAAHVGLDPASVPASAAQMRAYLASVRPRLRAGEQARQAVRFLLWPEVPRRMRALAPFKPLWLPVGALSYYTLPGWARREYGVLPEPPGTQAAATASLRALRAGLHALPDEVYNRVFDEATVERARTARRRLEEAGYDVSRGFAGLRDPRTWPERAPRARSGPE
ncbi:oxygenase MpaB family protein [Nocardiopsis baichengensis]|uniref:oxygenase MpaB family protein n=1 Tax=Nocardiopsis baichengensis TaxID=280240 RepID=UPI0003459164|nr:oxygenase MpaB family protein [Nocardiopsis baichengensis]